MAASVGGLGVVLSIAAVLGLFAGFGWSWLLGRDPVRAGLYCFLAMVPTAIVVSGVLGGELGIGVIVGGLAGLVAGGWAPKSGAGVVWPRGVGSRVQARSQARSSGPAARTPPPPGVFISYRRTDSPSAAGRLYDHLVAAFGEERVFKDVDSIPVGVDFDAHITQFIRSGATVLTLIGPRWLDTVNGARLRDEADAVRREIELARDCGARVIPVLIEGVDMPPPAALPSSLTFLTRINALRLRADPDFRRDVQGLIEVVKAGA